MVIASASGTRVRIPIGWKDFFHCRSRIIQTWNVAGHDPCGSGLPDGIFSNQKSKVGQILEGLAMENVGQFYVHLVKFTAIWYILWLFGLFFAGSSMLYDAKIWQPCCGLLNGKTKSTLTKTRSEALFKK
jgi:hypothetical protein